MGTHTPGPWAYKPTSGAIYYADGDVEPLIASTNLECVSVEQGDADGFLIAAAPDYDDAAEMLLKWFDNSGSGLSARWERIPPEARSAIVNAFRAARAKARGASA